MSKNFEGFMDTIGSQNTKKVAKSLSKIGEYDYSKITLVDLEQIILGMNPNSPKSITTTVYILSLYAKYLENDKLYYMSQDIDRSALWLMAKPNAPKKFISHSRFIEVCNDIETYEEYNSLYQQTLFRCLYEGIYNDDMSVIKNLRSSDINGDVVTLREDNGSCYDLMVSSSLTESLIKLGGIDTWSRNNRYGECKIKIDGLYKDTCFKVENRNGSKEYSYRYSYYRMLRKISKEYLQYNLLPLQLYISGLMYRIELNLFKHEITLDDAFATGNKSRLVNKIISDELVRCNCNTEVRNFREIVKGHIDIFSN